MKTPESPGDSVRPDGALYRAIWRWHFYAGLLCLPVLVLMAVTGALYLFNHEIEGLVYRELLRVPPAQAQAQAQAPALPPQQVVALAQAAVPGSVRAYDTPARLDASARVGLRTPEGAAVSVFVDPYRGTVLGSLHDDTRLMAVVAQLHSLALVGTWANMLVEVVAGWAIVLVVTGTWLWWPRGRRGGVVSVRSEPRRRLWWRDLHAVTGAFASAVVLFLALTGMPWSVFWGERYAQWSHALGLGLPDALWNAAPSSQLPLSSQGPVPWALQQAKLPLSTASPGTPGEPAHIGLNAAVDRFRALGLLPGFSVRLPADAHGVYTALQGTDQVALRRVVHLDAYSGQALVDASYADYGAAAQVTEWGISVHQGREYGLANQLLMLAGCLAIVLLAVSAVVMWWKRRPAGVLAAPQRRLDDRTARGAVVIGIALGLLFPLLGASMLLALAIDRLWPTRWRARWVI
jgi:uncharacterized iron-regulated membrane protein